MCQNTPSQSSRVGHSTSRTGGATRRQSGQRAVRACLSSAQTECLSELPPKHECRSMPRGTFGHLARISDTPGPHVARRSLSSDSALQFASMYSTLRSDFRSLVNVVDSSRPPAAPTGAPAHAATYASARRASPANSNS